MILGNFQHFSSQLKIQLAFRFFWFVTFRPASHSETLIQGALEIKFYRVKVEANYFSLDPKIRGRNTFEIFRYVLS